MLDNLNIKQARNTAKKMLNSLLVLLLLIAPFELLFAQINMTHELNQPSVSLSSSADDSHAHSRISVMVFDCHPDSNTVNNDDFEKFCPHCVFCSAAVSPILPLNGAQNGAHLLSIYNPHVNQLSSSLYPDLHLKPPITL